MALDIQVQSTGEYQTQKAVHATASVVEPVFQEALGKFDAGPVKKVVIVVPPELGFGGPRIAPSPPTGRDGDDVEEMTSKLSLDGFLELDTADRRLAVLEVIRDALVELARARGWPTEPIERAYATLAGQPIEFRWESRSVTSPSRRYRARAVGGIRESGAWLRVLVDDKDGSEVAASPEQRLRIPHPSELKLRAARIRWLNDDEVAVEAKGPRGLPASYPPITVTVDVRGK